MKRLLTLLFAIALVVPAAALAAKLSAPSSASVGDEVTGNASGLKPGRYVLRLSLDDTAGPRLACVARIGNLQDTKGGKVSISGHIPRKLTCYENDTVREGRIKTAPGKYHLVLGVPRGHSGFGAGSFVRRALTIKR